MFYKVVYDILQKEEEENSADAVTKRKATIQGKKLSIVLFKLDCIQSLFSFFEVHCAGWCFKFLRGIFYLMQYGLLSILTPFFLLKSAKKWYRAGQNKNKKQKNDSDKGGLQQFWSYNLFYVEYDLHVMVTRKMWNAQRRHATLGTTLCTHHYKLMPSLLVVVVSLKNSEASLTKTRGHEKGVLKGGHLIF